MGLHPPTKQIVSFCVDLETWLLFRNWLRVWGYGCGERGTGAGCGGKVRVQGTRTVHVPSQRTPSTRTLPVRYPC